jgi:type III restriction enzyme
LNKPADELGKIIHLYRDAITNDVKNQIEAHINDESKVNVYPRRGFIKFKPYSKTILAKEGIVHYSQEVPKADVGRYLFEGFQKTIYPQVAFKVTPEKDFAMILERDKEVIKWVRPPEGNIPIRWKGQNYNPDFVVQTNTGKYLIEIKARNELQPVINFEVKEKALAAIRWCESASKIEKALKWEYRLIPDDTIKLGYDFKFVIAHALNTTAF